MASLANVGDNLSTIINGKGEVLDIAISGTYAMTIEFQREQGSLNSGSWEKLRSYSTANATVADSYSSSQFDEQVRLIVVADTSGSATATLSDNDVVVVKRWLDQRGNTVAEITENGMVFKGDVSEQKAKVNIQTGTTYAFVEADSGTLVILNNASAITATIPSGISVGWHCQVVQLGAGQVTLVATGGNVRNRQTQTAMAGQYAACTVVCVSNTGVAPEIVLVGDTGA